MRTVILSVSLAIVLCFGCSKHDVAVNPQPEYEGIIPLAVGNGWHFAASLYDSSGAVSFSNNFSYEVVGDSVINGSRWFRISSFLCANRSSGFYSLSDAGELLLLKYPVSVLDSFYVNPVVGYLTVTSIDTLISTSVGSFRCIAFESHQPISTDPPAQWREVLYVAPHLGPVKGEIDVWPDADHRKYVFGTIELSSVTTN